MRLYSVPFVESAQTAIVDWWELTPADDKVLEVIGLELAQNSDFKDEQDEVIIYKVSRGWTTSGSGGSSPTPIPQDENDTAAGFTAEVNNTTVAKEGTEKIIHVGGFNVRAGTGPLWLPEGCGWKCSQAQTRLTIRPVKAPADSLTFSGTVYVREF